VVGGRDPAAVRAPDLFPPGSLARAAATSVAFLHQVDPLTPGPRPTRPGRAARAGCGPVSVLEARGLRYTIGTA
jgi:hypothetical protein